MWTKFTTEYVAGIIAGAGLSLFLLALSVDAGILTSDGLKSAGTRFAAISMVLAGGGMKLRTQNRKK